jgi:mannose-6-phosphate isomerase-like protein (cupin superfamily)
MSRLTTPARVLVRAGAPPRSHASRYLSDVVTSIAGNPASWRPRVRFSESERFWARLPGPEGVDVWLLTWLPSQATDLHDHGASEAAFTVVSGRLLEVRSTNGGSLRGHVARVGDVRTVGLGVVHDVRNAGVRPAVSIHAYSPRLSRMTLYAWSDGRALPLGTVVTDEPEVEP